MVNLISPGTGMSLIRSPPRSRCGGIGEYASRGLNHVPHTSGS